MLEAGEPLAQVGHLAPVERRRGHEHSRVSQTQALLDRLRPERREQRTEDAAVLERPERRHVQLGNPAREHEHALAAPYPQRVEHAREPIGLPLQAGVGEVRRRMALAQEAQRDRIRQRPVRVAIDRLVGDVETPAGEAGEPRLGRCPRELRPRPVVIGHVRSWSVRL